ncbi:MAG: PD-(D/E)XK nuclease family protein [Halioglobus sp.]
MPATNSNRLFDIATLKPLVDDGFTLLTPNFRMSRRIKSVWDQNQATQGRPVWESVTVLPLESWLQQRWYAAVAMGLLSPCTLINDSQAMELWQILVASHEAQSEQYTLLRPSASAKLAHEARETMLRWLVDADDPSVQQEFQLSLDCDTFRHWLALFNQRLERDQLITVAQAQLQLKAVSSALGTCKIALFGFDDIAPLSEACLHLSASELVRIDNGSESGVCIAEGYSDRRSELRAAARWAKVEHGADPTATLAIILPNMNTDRGALEYFLHCEFGQQPGDGQALPVNFSSGVALARVPLVRDGLAILGMAGEKIKVQAVVSLLTSRFIDLPDRHSAVVMKLISKLYNQGCEEISTGEVRSLANRVKLGEQAGTVFGRYLMELSTNQALRKKQLPCEWAEQIAALLACWGWPGPAKLDSVEYQQLEAFQGVLAGLGAFDAISGQLSLAALLQLLQRVCERQVFQAKTPDAPIQVLGMLEGAGLAFDQVRICSMQGASWPAPVRPNPLVPMSIQRRLQMPHATPEREWQFARALMDRYCRSASRITASYVRAVDGVPEVPSALLDGFVWVEPEQIDPGVADHWLINSPPVPLDSIQDDLAPALEVAEAKNVSGGSGLVEDQSNCPFRAFARRRLRVQPLPEFSIALSPAERGSILHDALFVLYQQLPDSQAVKSVNQENALELIREAAITALESVSGYRRIALGEAYLALEAQRLEALLQEWLQLEQQRGEYAIRALEQDIVLDIAPLEVRLRVDRIDQLPDDSNVIIDYKSGRCSVNDWLGDRPAKPQLLLYALGDNSSQDKPPLAGIAFAQLRPRDCKYVGAGVEEFAPGIKTDMEKLSQDGETWQSLTQHWHQLLQGLVAEFIRGEAVVAPTTSAACNYCGMESLCRVADAEGART